MIEAWIGRDGLSYGIVIDQLGSYLALSTFGLMVAARYQRPTMQWSVMWQRVLTFPPLIALVIALVLRPIPFHPALEDALGTESVQRSHRSRCSRSAVSCAWASCGKTRRVALGLGYKLVSVRC